MSTEQGNAPASTVAANIRNGKKAVGSAVAAVTLAAVTVLGVSGMTGGVGLDAASIITSPPNSASSRIAGVREDMARAVQLQQITPEQAAFLERQLVRRIQNGTETV